MIFRYTFEKESGYSRYSEQTDEDFADFEEVDYEYEASNKDVVNVLLDFYGDGIRKRLNIDDDVVLEEEIEDYIDYGSEVWSILQDAFRDKAYDEFLGD